MKTEPNEANVPTPWVYRRAITHFVIEAANGVRVAEIRFIGRPDGSTSERDARLIVAAVNKFAALAAIKDTP